MAVSAINAPRHWPARAAMYFVLATLVALVVVPVLVQRRVNAVRRVLEVAEPARTLVASLEFELARQLAALDEMQITRGAVGMASYDMARAAEDTIVRQLAPLVGRFGPDAARRFAVARARAERWHALVDPLRADPERLLETGGGRRPTDPTLFEEALAETAAIDSTILASTDRSRARIYGTERVGLRLTVALGFLALIAAAVVFSLGERAHRIAIESARRRVSAETALAEAARAEQSRARLIRGVTHDVKNPLGAAKGYAELLSTGVRGPLTPEQVPLVRGIERTIENALQIIADLLDIARAASGGLTLRLAAVNLVTVVREAVEEHRGSAEAAGHTLELRPATDRITIDTDPDRVVQILANLLSNAVKYTPAPGRITVLVATASDGEGEGGAKWAEVSVSDTGPGIPPESRGTIFDEFARLERGAKRRGHGLGLAIARRLARLLGGDLVLADGPGPGATFVLRLPLDGDAGVKKSVEE